MPENTITTPLAPMGSEDVAAAFAYIRARLVGDIDTAGAIADDTGLEQLHRLLVDVAARVFIPVTAVDDTPDLADHVAAVGYDAQRGELTLRPDSTAWATGPSGGGTVHR
ncbi:hypothetical protein [Streptomyces sp. NPDC058622]|uniref:hypothetical protein n=1 Tax=Streptomyces sp. NPDC058622 TaxID=3346562 RepID=UPI003663BEBB